MIRRALRLIPEAMMTAAAFALLWWAFVTIAALNAPQL